jgi:hypothetical protein
MSSGELMYLMYHLDVIIVELGAILAWLWRKQ